jgi:hypothetical protein
VFQVLTRHHTWFIESILVLDQFPQTTVFPIATHLVSCCAHGDEVELWGLRGGPRGRHTTSWCTGVGACRHNTHMQHSDLHVGLSKTATHTGESMVCN